MKKKLSILRFREISFIDLLRYLLKNAWAALLIALAAALIAWTVLGVPSPSEYTGSLTISLRSTAVSENWNEQLTLSKSAASRLTKAINDGTVSTNFASQTFNRSINATANATIVASSDADPLITNLVTITVTDSTSDEVYLYLMALEENLDRLAEMAGFTDIAISAASEPTMPVSSPDYSDRTMLTLLSAVAAGGLTVVLIVLLRLIECSPATRKAAERLSVRPIAGALKKGGAGKGIDAYLPLPTAENADGCYVQNLNDAASFLLGQQAKHLQIASLSASNARPEEAERLALDLALAMAGQGADICLIDDTGYARALLPIEKTFKPDVYKIKGSRLTIVASSADTDRFDKVVYATDKPTECEDTHTLWVVPAGRYTAKQINAVTASDGTATASASLLLYGLYTVGDTKGCPDESEEDSEDDDIDLLKWMAAAFRAMWRIKYKWLVSFAVVTVVALGAGYLLGNSSYRMDTVFTVMTDDVTSALSADRLASLTVDEAVDLMDQGTEQTIYGDALYPSSLAHDRDLLMKTMTVVWNTPRVEEAIECQLDHKALSESLSVSMNSDGERFTLSVEGSDSANLSEVTEAFFDVAPSISAPTAGGLTFFANESSVFTTGPNVLLLLIVAWVLVIGVGCVYALIAGFFDRTALLRYEAEEALSARVIDKMPIRSAKGETLDTAETASIELARFLYEWTEDQTSGAVLMITSALRDEGTAQLTRAVEALLKQNGKRVAIADQSVCSKILTEGREALATLLQNYDYILIDRPGMAVDSDVAEIAEQADALLWAIRVGYADKERLEAASSTCPNEKVLGCVRMIG